MRVGGIVTELLSNIVCTIHNKYGRRQRMNTLWLFLSWAAAREGCGVAAAYLPRGGGKYNRALTHLR